VGRALATLAAAASLAAPATAGAAQPVAAIFYYPWYGTPAHDGEYLHWGQNGAVAPVAIASSHFPMRGVYSSSDRAVVDGQMDEISSAGIETVVVSWWGSGSAEDARLDVTALAAGARGLHVAVHIEPYPGRTPESVGEDVRTLRERGITDFYVYDSTSTPDDRWATVNAGLDGVRVFANTGLPGKAVAGGFEGLYTYDVLTYNGSSFPRMCESARRLRLVCAPSVGPGFDARRATGDPRLRPRLDGATYDQMWRAAVRAAPEVVTVTSYNEWHEGTQIEPAQPIGRAYASYEGAWGLTGLSAARAYLYRTAVWADRYAARMAQNNAVASLRR